LSIASSDVLQTYKATIPDDGGVGSGVYGAGSIAFLDRHAVKCDSDKVLTQVQLKTEATLGQSGYKIFYEFYCAIPVYPVNSQTCVEYFTDYAERGTTTGMVFLDRHDITCKNTGELLQGFGLNNRGSDSFIRFSFTCCVSSSPTTNPTALPSIPTINPTNPTIIPTVVPSSVPSGTI
jgi:hypothetical protein